MHRASQNLTASHPSRLVAGLSAALLLQACASTLPPAELSPAHPVGKIQVISGETFLRHRFVQTLTNESCLPSPHDGVQAKEQMVKKAYLHGADAVVHYRCQSINKLTVPKGRVKCRICTGDAIKWKYQSAPMVEITGAKRTSN